MVPREIAMLTEGTFCRAENQSQSPAILRATRESRQEAKRYYTFCKDVELFCNPQPPFPCTSPGASPHTNVWINFVVDYFVVDIGTLGYGGAITFFDFDYEVIKKIQHLKVTYTKSMDCLMTYLRRLNGLLAKRDFNSLTIACHENIAIPPDVPYVENSLLKEMGVELLKEIDKYQERHGWTIRSPRQVEWDFYGRIWRE
jgi:hypothetical protein